MFSHLRYVVCAKKIQNKVSESTFKCLHVHVGVMYLIKGWKICRVAWIESNLENQSESEERCRFSSVY